MRGAGSGVAVLVDEYDKPILDALETPEVARANRSDWARSSSSGVHLRVQHGCGDHPGCSAARGAGSGHDIFTNDRHRPRILPVHTSEPTAGVAGPSDSRLRRVHHRHTSTPRHVAL